MDWRKIITDEGNPWSERSKQSRINLISKLMQRRQSFMKMNLFQNSIKNWRKTRDGEWVAVDSEDEMVVNFYYPQIFESEYLRSCVRLEIVH